MVESDTGGRIVTTSESENPDYISITQASEMALRMARASATRQRGLSRRRMLFDVVDEDEDKYGYTLVLSFRPEGDFEGTPGQERFKFSKTGRFQGREVLHQPKVSKRFRIKRKTVIVSIVVVILLIGFTGLVIVLERGARCPAIECQKSGGFPQTEFVTTRTIGSGSQSISGNQHFNPRLQY